MKSSSYAKKVNSKADIACETELPSDAENVRLKVPAWAGLVDPWIVKTFEFVPVPCVTVAVLPKLPVLTV